MVLKIENIIFKIRRSKVTDYAALKFLGFFYSVSYDNNEYKILISIDRRLNR